jgi:hypothetical protein
MSRPSPIREELAGAVAFSPRAGEIAPPCDPDVDEARTPPPVFVHSSWRTGSTWLWSKLRQAPNAIAYCEIFNERLKNCTVQNLRDNDFAKWNSKHPEGAPYFLEFAPLVGADGAVKGFDPSMAIERFMPADGLHGALSVAEQAYIEGLIENAAQRRKLPVLTDTRTLGRLRAIAKAFPGRHVLLVRNLFHQWASYSEQRADGNRYFLEMLFETVEASRHDPFVKLIADWFADEDRSETSERIFQLFLLFHLYLYAHAYDAADCVVDLNRVAADPEARQAAEGRLSDYVGFPIDLADAQIPFGLSLFSVRSKTAFVDTIDQFVKLMLDASISRTAARFIAEAKDEALAEWERSEFYNASSRSYFVRRLSLADHAANQCATAQAPSDAGRQRPQLSLDSSTGERDAPATHVAGADAEGARVSAPAKSRAKGRRRATTKTSTDKAGS